MHQRSATDVTDEPVELRFRLPRDRSWWLGSVVVAVGFALQAAVFTAAIVTTGVAGAAPARGEAADGDARRLA